MSKTLNNQMVEWNLIPWRKLERHVFKLQKRIFQASVRGDTKAVRRLQKTLMRSWSAKALAVRKVQKDNQGKKTAGVDGVKSLTSKARITLIVNLKLTNKVKATRRVWIPKPGTEEKRPLGIPTMQDRATQALVKLALESEWEAKFEPNSYGFRPGRSAHDAIGAIFSQIKQKPKWVLDADISKCFDKINHKKLLTKINTFPTLNRLIKAWLKSGVFDGGEWSKTDEGTPQGGVISPLLANIALHGMEEEINKIAESLPGNKKSNQKALSLIRYADDFVILHPDLDVIVRCKAEISTWLEKMGLELKPNKTRIGHTLQKPNIKSQEGFDFLGFNIRQYKVGKTQSGKSSQGKLLGFKTLIKPSVKAIKRHYDEICRLIDAHKSAPQEALIKRLNPVIRGWANYYSMVISKEIFSDIDRLIFQKLQSWAKRRHPGKTGHWISVKYWKTRGDDNWVFASTKEGKVTSTLLKHAKTEIVRHVKVRGKASPFDGNLVYWSERKGKNPLLPTRVTLLLKKQKGKCAYCGLYFREDDVMEVDHIIPKSKGGKDVYKNLQLLHRHCHDEKTARDGNRYV
ncbi:MAG: group II intron reverse transcriptase/maturase [Tolypothrix carrinoi HA7290-LM1]|nr:group II intron reverse transcriptase/maturase [Tolypothrix carrinoi HA7290-LM1]